MDWPEKGIWKRLCLAKIAVHLASKNEAPSRDVKLGIKIWCRAPKAGLEKSCAVTVLGADSGNLNSNCYHITEKS